MDKLDLQNFDWGWMGKDSLSSYIHPDGRVQPSSEFHKQQIIQEIYTLNMYEKFFEVEENDIVLDVGASHGPFTYSILHKKPKHVFCVEPSQVEFPVLVKNTIGFPVTQINKGLYDSEKIIENHMLFGDNKIMESITFDGLLNLYNLTKIDFLKTDCEGGEYSIFNIDNFEYITRNVKKIVGEWHLSSPELKNKFRDFRSIYLKYFDNVNVYSVDNIDIKWDLWNEHFLDYYNEVIIYIDNR